MSSNFPPGVTGNEYQIAGGVTVTMTVACPTVGLDMYSQHQVDDAIDHLSDVLRNPITVRAEGQRGWRTETPAEQIVRVQNALLRVREELDTSTLTDSDFECDFTGEVDGELYDGTACWECPRCGAHHDDQLPEGEPGDGADMYETADEYADAREDLGDGATEDQVRNVAEQRAAVAHAELDDTTPGGMS